MFLFNVDKWDNIVIFGKSISSYAIMMVIGVICCSLVFFYRLRKYGTDEKTIDRLTIITLIGGMFVYLGASFFDTLWHCIELHLETGEPFKLDFNEGGITFAGGIITGIIVFFIIYPFGMKYDKNRAINYMDQIVIGILIAHCFGRIGCFLAGCCYGKETDFFLGIPYSEAGKDEITGQYLIVHPTQLYEAAFLLIAFIIFFLFLKKYHTETYLISYGIFRIFIEMLRGDDRGASPFGFLTPSQFMSIIMIAGGILIFFLRKRVLKKELEKYHQDPTSITPRIRYYEASYKNIFKGLTKKCNCPTCNNKMKLSWHKEITEVNEVELKNTEHLVYYCKECNIEQEIE
ncbi:MAG: prolipoprotein diacylglyceryl transferase [Erysipelotrichaceae bacterium]|nr:prolipoprotein diacylglyceryl transferase [Erysipelotrichaceae bacterium]